LLDKGLLTYDKGIYKVYDLFFAIWLARNFRKVLQEIAKTPITATRMGSGHRKIRVSLTNAHSVYFDTYRMLFISPNHQPIKIIVLPDVRT